jgi:hypothetical protein
VVLKLSAWGAFELQLRAAIDCLLRFFLNIPNVVYEEEDIDRHYIIIDPIGISAT